MRRRHVLARASLAALGALAFACSLAFGRTSAAESTDRPLVEGDRRVMGTIWSVRISGADDEAAARRVIETALDEVERLEEELSEWLPESEISRVNAAAGRRPVRVGEALFTCVRASLDVARWSEGAYDITWAALRDLWDFSPTGRRVPPSEDVVRARLPLWNYRNVVIDERRHTVFLRRRGMAIGLGGVAKGYALDRVGAILADAGYPDHLVFGGGQILVGGRRGDRPWRVGIQHPRDPERHFAFIEVAGPASVSTSGDYEHAYLYEGRRYHHILDPATGFPAERTASVTLVARSALWADAVDTAVFILGPERGLHMLPDAPGGPYEAVVVDPSLRLSTTPMIANRLVMRARLDAEGRIGGWLP